MRCCYGIRDGIRDRRRSGSRGLCIGSSVVDVSERLFGLRAGTATTTARYWLTGARSLRLCGLFKVGGAIVGGVGQYYE